MSPEPRISSSSRLAAQAVAPARVGRLAGDDPRDVALAREREHRAGDRRPGQPQRLAAERLGERHVSLDAIAILGRQRRRAGDVDVHREPRCVHAVGDPPRGAYELLRGGARADAHQQPLARRPQRADPLLAPVRLDVGVDALRGPPQRELAQRHQVAAPEVVVDRAARLLGHVDLALGEPLQQLLRRQIDELDLVGALEHRVGDGLAHRARR